MSQKRKASLFIVAAPSGGGKTSLVKKILQELPDIEVSISHTTRPLRPGEVHGQHYHFINETDFQNMIAADAFLEYAKVFGFYYGTSWQQIKDKLSAGIDIILDIDWQGAQQIRHLFPDVVTVFILPPSLQILKQRLMDRKRDDEEVITRRMQLAKDEISHYAEFDYLIVNDNFEQAGIELTSIIRATRLKTANQVENLAEHLSILLSCE